MTETGCGTRILLLALIGALILIVSCVSQPKPEQRYPIEGRVIAIDQAKREITLQHKEIPGYMAAMTMPFRVRDERVFNVAHLGDGLRGTLVVSAGSAYIVDISINRNAAGASARSTFGACLKNTDRTRALGRKTRFPGELNY